VARPLDRDRYLRWSQGCWLVPSRRAIGAWQANVPLVGARNRQTTFMAISLAGS